MQIGSSVSGNDPWDDIIKAHVHGFFNTDLHEVSSHFATYKAIRLSGF